jgi:hypothetical protein
MSSSSSRTNVTSMSTWKESISPFVTLIFCSLTHAPSTLRRVLVARCQQIDWTPPVPGLYGSSFRLGE